jgi:hypothetical protein
MRTILAAFAACVCASGARIPVTGWGGAACNVWDPQGENIGHGGYELYVSGEDLSFWSTRGGAFPSTGYTGCAIIYGPRTSLGTDLFYPGHPDGGYATIGDSYSSNFTFALGGGRGFLELYDEISGDVIARADLLSWVALDNIRREDPGPNYESLVADIVVSSAPIVPEPATWLISVAGLGLIALRRAIKHRGGPRAVAGGPRVPLRSSGSEC